MGAKPKAEAGKAKANNRAKRADAVNGGSDQMVGVKVWMPLALKKRLQVLAEQKGRSISWEAMAAIEAVLERAGLWPPEEEKESPGGVRTPSVLYVAQVGPPPQQATAAFWAGPAN